MQEEKIILIHADASNTDSLQDANTSAALRFRRGDTITIDALLSFKGELANLDKFRNATLEILDVGALNAPAPRSINVLMWQRLTEFESPAKDSEGNAAQDAKHLRFAFSKEESAIECGEKWLRLYVDFKNGKRLTFASGWIYVDENFSADASLMPMESPEFIGRSEMEEIYYSKEEIQKIRYEIEVIQITSSQTLSDAKYSIEEAKRVLDDVNQAQYSAESNKNRAEQHANDCAVYTSEVSSALSKVSEYYNLSGDLQKAAASSAAAAKEYAECGISAMITKEVRDAVCTPTGGHVKILRSSTVMSSSAPFSCALTLNLKEAIDPSDTKYYVLACSFIYPGTGIRFSYQPSTKKISIRYASGTWTFRNGETILSAGLPLGLHTYAFSISADIPQEITMWIDGVKQALSFSTSGTVESIATQGDFFIGGSTGGYANDADIRAGVIGEFSRIAFFRRVLAEGEVLEYSAGKTLQDPVCDLDASNDLQIRDRSGNAFHGALLSGAVPNKAKDVFVVSDICTWAAIGQKYFLTSTQKILPDNCEVRPVVVSNTGCILTIKNGAGSVIATPVLYANTPAKLESFINTTDGKLIFTPSVSSLTVKINLEIRKF